MDELRDHLEARYGGRVGRIARLDEGVFRVGRSGDPDWVARLFGPERTVADAEADAQILRALERAGFPAERCADEQPVSAINGRAVLITEYVDGVPAGGRGRTFAVLGSLLGRLHGRTAASMRPGGAWHHLSPRGTPSDEVAAATALLESHSRRITASDTAAYDRLRQRVESTDTCTDLPHAFVHPDFVPANAILTRDERTVIIDWANSGRGPRLWSLAFLLWAGGARDLRLVDLVVSRYQRHTRIDAAEMDRLPGAIRARPLLLDTWSVCNGRKQLAGLGEQLQHYDDLSQAIAARARDAFTAGPVSAAGAPASPGWITRGQPLRLSRSRCAGQ